MDGPIGQAGAISAVSPAALEASLQKQAEAQAAAAMQPVSAPQELVGYIRTQFEIMRNHRNSAHGWNDRLLHSLRTFNGQYDGTKLQQIKMFGGSDVYARLTAQKCRSASSLLRDIYLGPDRPWAVRPPADPDIPKEIQQSIEQLVQTEAQQVMATMGRPAKGGDLEKRKQALMDSASDAARKKAGTRARESEDQIEDLLRAGGFYTALAEFIIDLPIFPFACIKGPVVKVIPTVTWPPGGGQPSVTQKPTLTWNRVSPFDLWFTPGVSDIENANVIEKLRITRAELNDLLDLPGYNQSEIRAVLDEYGRGGLYDNWDTTDAERAVLESRENPAWNRSGMLTMMEFNGNVQGRMLQDYGLAVPDELRDYHVQAWVVGNHVVKCHLSPSPRQRHPYFITSFEKIPGSVIGNSLVDLLSDIQESANATLRATINNLSIASGPQVVIEDDRITPGTDNDTLHPWKRWHTRADPVGNNSKPPVSFFMPTSNAQQLIEVYKHFVEIADEVSSIPKYVGGGSSGGAGRTASGLAMLMGNASKILQTVSANIDRDVMEQLLKLLSDLIMLTDTTGILSGEESVSVMGVNVAIQRETIRQRQIEFLQATANPLDQSIIGIPGRGKLLRAVSTGIGVSEDIVPDDAVLENMEKAQKEQKAHGPMQEVVEKGVQAGVEAGVKRITTEITAGELAMRQEMPMGDPGQEQGGPATNDPEMDLGPGGDAARQAQGSQTKRQGSGMAPQTSLTGNMPGPGSRLSPGIG
jgi:uncharacterized protein (DUF4415 family)